MLEAQPLGGPVVPFAQFLVGSGFPCKKEPTKKKGTLIAT